MVRGDRDADPGYAAGSSSMGAPVSAPVTYR